MLVQALSEQASNAPVKVSAYGCLLSDLNSVTEAAIDAAMEGLEGMSEPQLARDLSSLLPAGELIPCKAALVIESDNCCHAYTKGRSPHRKDAGVAWHSNGG